MDEQHNIDSKYQKKAEKGKIFSIFAIIFGILSFLPIPYVAMILAPSAVVLAIIGFVLSKSRRNVIAITSVLVAVITLIIWVGGAINTFNRYSEEIKYACEYKSKYQEISIGEKIETEFVTITIDDVSIYSGELYGDTGSVAIIKGTITNKSDITYDLGGTNPLGTGSVENFPMIDCRLMIKHKIINLWTLDTKDINGNIPTKSLQIFRGDVLGNNPFDIEITPETLDKFNYAFDSKIAPQETVEFNISVNIPHSYQHSDVRLGVTIAFTENFQEVPNSKRSNCGYFYKIKFKEN